MEIITRRITHQKLEAYISNSGVLILVGHFIYFPDSPSGWRFVFKLPYPENNPAYILGETGILAINNKLTTLTLPTE